MPSREPWLVVGLSTVTLAAPGTQCVDSVDALGDGTDFK